MRPTDLEIKALKQAGWIWEKEYFEEDRPFTASKLDENNDLICAVCFSAGRLSDAVRTTIECAFESVNIYEYLLIDYTDAEILDTVHEWQALVRLDEALY